MRTTVAQRICDGTSTLHDLCGELSTDVAMCLWMTAENSAFSRYTAAMAGYLDAVFAADLEAVPAGVTVWRPNASITVPYVSHGDQTLQGYADAWDCHCHAIIQLTAEYSPGAVFGAGISKHLEGVFQRSAIPVPGGTVLFYLTGGNA